MWHSMDHLQVFLLQLWLRYFSSPGSPDDPKSSPTEVDKCVAPEPTTSVEDEEREVVGGCSGAPRCCAAYSIFGLLRKASWRREINAMLIRCPYFTGGVWLERRLSEGWLWPFELLPLSGPRAAGQFGHWTHLNSAGWKGWTLAALTYFGKIYLMRNLSIFGFPAPRKIKNFRY